MEGVIEGKYLLDTQNRFLDHLPLPNHPNYELWRNYALFSYKRGRLVANVLSEFMNLRSARILDAGCGVGGASIALAERGASVIASDTDSLKVKALRKLSQEQNLPIRTKISSVEEFVAPNNSLDAVVLQDVMEHLYNPSSVMRHIASLLKPDGLVYISTPNRWSPFNMLCDPHWNLPVVGMLSRKYVGLIVRKLLKRVEIDKTDLAALLSFSKIQKLLVQNGLEMHFINRRVAMEMAKELRCVLNSHWHLRAFTIIKRFGLAPSLPKLVNDNLGLFNRLFNPTWFILARKL